MTSNSVSRQTEEIFVDKFGGTSGKDGSTLEHIIDNIVLRDRRRRVLTFSAPGKRHKDDIKITDLLIDAGESYYESKQYPTELVDNVKDRFYEIIDHFCIEHSFLDPAFKSLENTIKGKINRYKGTGVKKLKYLDSIKRYGELIQCEIVAEALRRRGANARVYHPEDIGMITDSNFGNAKLQDFSYKKIAENLKPVLKNTDEIIIVPGFYGIDKHSNFTTFSRGGTDLTGAILANAANAKEYENWTDEDGIKRASPKIIENPDIIEEMTYKEARELAYSGAVVLHPDTLIPLMKKGILLHVRNTFNPEKKGTYIGATKKLDGHIVEGIAHKEGFTVFYIEKMGMNEEVGYIDRLTNVFAKYGVSIDQMTTSIDSVSIAIADSGNNRKLNKVRDKIIKEGFVDSPDDVNVEYDKAMVCAVGEGMRHTPGVLEKLSGALRSGGINIETVYQGPSERSIIFGIAQKDAVNAVRAIYNLYFSKPIK